MTKTKTQRRCLKTQHMVHFWNPDDLLIPNMMIDTSPWSSCSRRSPLLPYSSHTISSTGPSVTFQDFLSKKFAEQWYCGCRKFRFSLMLFPNVFKNIFHVCTNMQSNMLISKFPFLNHYSCLKAFIPLIFCPCLNPYSIFLKFKFLQTFYQNIRIYIVHNHIHC